MMNEAAKAIKRLSVEKTIDVGGYNPALLDGNAKDVQVDRPWPSCSHSEIGRQKPC